LINSATIKSGEFNAKRRSKINTRVRVFYILKDSSKIATKIVEEKFLVPSFLLVLPLPSYIPPTVISGIGMGNMNGIGKVTTYGYGVGAEARINTGYRLFFDMISYTYKQELAEKGSTNVSTHIGTGYFIDLPMGAKYTTSTLSMRLGLKYVFFREKNFQPWIGVGYSINIWNAQYTNMDEDKIYGKANGSVGRSSILAGVDLKLFGNSTLSFFYEAISPVANYTIDLPAFGGTYSSFEGMTFPTPRVGASFGGF
jgi:hypothetical protein